MYKTASADLIVSLLGVLDDFERALKLLEAKEGIKDDPVFQGINLIYTKLKNILVQKGLKEIDAIGKEFDTDFHEAITNIPAESEEMKGKIIDVTEKGYLLNEKVIRYAKVVVGL